MTVKAILAQKGRNVVKIAPSSTLSEALEVLAQNRIGAVIVAADGRLDGILSERDIVRAIARAGASVLSRPAEEVMTRRVVSCRERDTIGDVMESMTQGKFRHLPVVEDGRLVGLISIGDVVKHRLEEIQRESNALREYILTA